MASPGRAHIDICLSTSSQNSVCVRLSVCLCVCNGKMMEKKKKRKQQKDVIALRPMILIILARLSTGTSANCAPRYLLNVRGACTEAATKWGPKRGPVGMFHIQSSAAAQFAAQDSSAYFFLVRPPLTYLCSFILLAEPIRAEPSKNELCAPFRPP